MLLPDQLRRFGLALEQVANEKLPKIQNTSWAQTAGIHWLHRLRKKLKTLSF
jgi:hypothetical protein